MKMLRDRSDSGKVPQNGCPDNGRIPNRDDVADFPVWRQIANIQDTIVVGSRRVEPRHHRLGV